MAPVSKETQDFLNKISVGFKLAYEKLVKESAAQGRSLVLGKNGKPIHVPAVELLRKLEEKKKI